MVAGGFPFSYLFIDRWADWFHLLTHIGHFNKHFSFTALFVFSLSDICEPTAGSTTGNNGVQMFQDMLKNEALSGIPIVLILNKIDDFQEKFKDPKLIEKWRKTKGLQEESEIL